MGTGSSVLDEAAGKSHKLKTFLQEKKEDVEKIKNRLSSPQWKFKNHFEWHNVEIIVFQIDVYLRNEKLFLFVYKDDHCIMVLDNKNGESDDFIKFLNDTKIVDLSDWDKFFTILRQFGTFKNYDGNMSKLIVN
jgi:hypothetical protein